MKLTRETAPILAAGISVDRLPRTFQDAVFVARKFGALYLWIDSLSIFQDNIDDWSVEAVSMRDVYSRAACCIAATSSENSNGGLFFKRHATGLVRIQDYRLSHGPGPGAYWCDIASLYSTYVQGCPLNTRAWVAKEHYLSPRIMHFNAPMLFWECQESIASEVYPSGLPSWNPYGKSNVTAHLKEALMSYLKIKGENHILCSNETSTNELDLAEIKAREIVYSSWDNFIDYYSSLKMTKREDKLTALAGIAKDVAEALDDKLIAGLWKSRLAVQLLWGKVTLPRTVWQLWPNRKKQKWIAPTWSWASTNDEIIFFKTYGASNPSNMRNIHVEILNIQVDSKESGELISASFSMRCRPIFVFMQYNGRIDDVTLRFRPVNTEPHDRTKAEVRAIGSLMFDYFDKDYATAAREVYLIIVHCLRRTNREKLGMECLMLIPHASKIDTFYRIGLLRLDQRDKQHVEDMETYLGRHGIAETPVIHIM